MEKGTVRLEPYDSNWPNIFEQETEVITKVLQENLVECYHIGSTSIPGMIAKPIIDILPVVRDLTKVESINSAFAQKGYIARGEHGLPGRRFFIKGEMLRTHHVHIYQIGHPDIESHLLFRDYLRSFQEEANAYADLKRNLAEKYPLDRPAYTEGKDSFIKERIQRARRWRNIE